MWEGKQTTYLALSAYLYVCRFKAPFLPLYRLVLTSRSHISHPPARALSFFVDFSSSVFDFLRRANVSLAPTSSTKLVVPTDCGNYRQNSGIFIAPCCARESAELLDQWIEGTRRRGFLFPFEQAVIPTLDTQRVASISHGRNTWHVGRISCNPHQAYVVPR